MDISVVVPLYNEEESLPELFAWIERVMNANGFSYEVIFVNDGSTDRSWHLFLGGLIACSPKTAVNETDLLGQSITLCTSEITLS